MNRPPSQKTRGFTLVEMMVVITIIGMLTGLLLVGVNAARRAAKRTAILTEMQQIDGSMKELKNELGAFPPNLAHVENTQQYFITPGHAAVLADARRFLKKAFPRNNEPDAVIQQLVAAPGNRYASNDTYTEGMNGAEALVFWLGGFSDDPKYPISGKGGPAFDRTMSTYESLEDRKFKFGFDQSRLGPKDDSGQFNGRYIEYQHPVTNNTMRINLWTYTPSGSKSPMTYFDTSRYTPSQYDIPFIPPTSSEVRVYPIKQLKSGAPAGSTAPADYVYANPQSFQILHPGIDDEWPDWNQNTPNLSLQAIVDNNGYGRVYPTGPFTEELSDTLVNFSTKSLEDSEE